MEMKNTAIRYSETRRLLLCVWWWWWWCVCVCVCFSLLAITKRLQGPKDTNRKKTKGTQNFERRFLR